MTSKRILLLVGLLLLALGATLYAPVWRRTALTPYTTYVTETSMSPFTSVAYSTYLYTTSEVDVKTFYLSGEYKFYPHYIYYAFLEGLEAGDAVYVKIDTHGNYYVDAEIKDPNGASVWKRSGSYIEDLIVIKFPGRYRLYLATKNISGPQVGFCEVAGLYLTIATKTSIQSLTIVTQKTVFFTRESTGTSVSTSLSSHAYAFPLALILVILGVALAVLPLLRPKKLEKPKGAFKYCIECGKRIPIDARVCPYCGAKQET